MLLGGLWHGVSVTFILWGLFHGVALALHKLWLGIVPGAKALGEQMRPVWRFLGAVLTFHIVAFGWLLFTAKDMKQVETVLHNITCITHCKNRLQIFLLYMIVKNSIFGAINRRRIKRNLVSIYS